MDKCNHLLGVQADEDCGLLGVRAGDAVDERTAYSNFKFCPECGENVVEIAAAKNALIEADTARRREEWLAGAPAREAARLEEEALRLEEERRKKAAENLRRKSMTPDRRNYEDALSRAWNKTVQR